MPGLAENVLVQLGEGEKSLSLFLVGMMEWLQQCSPLADYSQKKKKKCIRY